jgi:hypothetical protein
MITASRLKMLVMGLSAGLLFVASASYAAQYDYIPSNLKVAYTPAGGQKLSRSFQQQGQLEGEETVAVNTNTLNVSSATADAYGILNAQSTNGGSTTITTCSPASATCGLPIQVQSQVDVSNTLSGVLQLQGSVDSLSVTSSNGGTSYTVQDTLETDLTSSGASIPSSDAGTSYAAGTQFAVVNAPVTVNVNSKPETDQFNGKIVFGDVKPIEDQYGNVTGTRFAEVHLVGTITDSAGNSYKVNQFIGESDFNGVQPSQVNVSGFSVVLFDTP